MLRRAVTRWGSGSCALVAALLLGATTAGADVTVERTMKSGGFAGIGAGDTTSVEKLSGLRKRAVSTTKMTGFLGRLAGDLGADEITDIQKDVIWKIDHKKKTYTESKITPPPEPKEAAGEKPGSEEQAEKPKVRIVRNEVTVKETGEKKTIGEYPCAHYVITWVVETEDLETRERGESTMTTDLWTTPENAETRALTKEEREFTQAWLKKIGWDMSDQEARTMGLTLVGAMIGGDEASFKKGVKEVAEKMEKVKGFPIATGIAWQVKTSGATAAKKSSDESASPEGVQDIAKGLGSLMAGFGKKAGKESPGTSGESGTSTGKSSGATPVFETYVEIHKISTTSLADSDFVPPAGYKKVEP